MPFPPGGAADTFARFIGDRLAQSWGQGVVVDNRPGGGGIVATQAAAKAPADGYTLLVVTVGHAVNPHLHAKLPYDTEKDLQAIAKLASVPSVLVVNSDLPARNIAELIALAKSKPGKLTYASSGNATTSHVAGAMFVAGAGTSIVHVPYKGSAPAITDLIAGHVDLIIDPLVSSAQHIKSGKLRALAVSDREALGRGARLPPSPNPACRVTTSLPGSCCCRQAACPPRSPASSTRRCSASWPRPKRSRSTKSWAPNRALVHRRSWRVSFPARSDAMPTW